MEWLMLHEIVMASMLPKPQQPAPADPPLFSISTPIWATLVLRPNRRCNATTTQTSAVRHTAGIEKKTHLGGEFRCHKSSGLAVIEHSWLVAKPDKSSSRTSHLWSRDVARWCRCGLSVAGPFVRRCLTSLTMLPFPHPAHRTGCADFPLPPLGERFTMSHTGDGVAAW